LEDRDVLLTVAEVTAAFVGFATLAVATTTRREQDSEEEVTVRFVSTTLSELVVVHRQLVGPFVAAAIVVVGVAVETAGSAPSLSIGEWIAAGIGMIVGSFISYLCVSCTRVVFNVRCGPCGQGG
jgi:hypothetical protein